MLEAYNAVTKNKMKVFAAAKQYGVPETTLRDRVEGRINMTVTTNGIPQTFTLTQEKRLIDHFMDSADLGYPFTKTEAVKFASKLAVELGALEPGKELSYRWFEGLKRRWPDLIICKPLSLAAARAYVSREVIDHYSAELNNTLEKYGLKDKPHLIYNVDETGVNTEHKPPRAIGKKHTKMQAVTSPRSSNITVIACGNAMGTCLPPYLVYPGKRMQPHYLEGATPGPFSFLSFTFIHRVTRKLQ